MATQMEGRHRPSTRFRLSQTTDSVDTITYFYHLPYAARERGWDMTQAGIMSFVSSSFTSNHDAVVG
eukprot:6599133-Pyramimonas_sp.AAC.1